MRWSPLRLDENPSLHHPEQNQPFHRHDGRGLEEVSALTQMRGDRPSKDISSDANRNNAAEHVNEDGIHPERSEDDGPFPVAGHLDKPKEDEQLEAGHAGARQTLGGRPHFHFDGDEGTQPKSERQKQQPHASNNLCLCCLETSSQQQFANQQSKKGSRKGGDRRQKSTPAFVPIRPSVPAMLPKQRDVHGMDEIVIQTIGACRNAGRGTKASRQA